MIGVIIPAYNCRETLPRTLASLAAQIDKDFKVYVIDDKSKESLEDIVNQFKNLINIKYIRKEKNEGCGMARQTGIDACEEDYFTFIDSDDVMMPHATLVFNDFISKNPDINLIHTYFVYENNKALLRKTEGYSWCHGRVYNKSIFEKYGIKALPHFTCWADDTYINTICFELEPTAIVPVETYIWCNNINSITHTRKDRNIQPVLECLFACYDIILKHKQSNRLLDTSIQAYIKLRGAYSDLENEMLDDLIKLNEIIKTTQDIEEEQKIINKWRYIWEQS